MREFENLPKKMLPEWEIEILAKNKLSFIKVQGSLLFIIFVVAICGV